MTQQRIIALVIFRNESIFLPIFLKQLEGIVDEILGYDDGSSDNSREIFLAFGGTLLKKTMQKPPGSGATSEIRQELLNEGRNMGGTHFVVLDSDEFFCGAPASDIRKSIMDLRPGEKLVCDWIMLASTNGMYCNNRSVWKPNPKDFAFADSLSLNYPNDEFVHFSRTPDSLQSPLIKHIAFAQFGVVHLQFLNYQLGQLKQCWYRCKEVVDLKRVVILVNRRYEFTKEKFDTNSLSTLPENYLEDLVKIDLSRIVERNVKDSWYFEDLKSKLANEKRRNVHTIDIWFLPDMVVLYRELFGDSFKEIPLLEYRDKLLLKIHHIRFIFQNFLAKCPKLF